MTTTNPIIPGFHPDPSICRVGDHYWLVNSTFEYLPGVPVWHSRDLVSWTLAGHVIDRPEQLSFPSSKGSSGIFAPTIRHHDGTFYMVTTSIDHIQQGHFICHADDPAGPWSNPVFVEGTMGIDPDLFWDADGSCWLSWTGGAIKQVRVNPMTGERLSEPRLLWPGTGLANPEGPHLFRRGDWYYCLLAEGGTERGHAVTIARSRSIEGPWESNPANPILSHRSSTLPVQNTGHADLVECADGTWAIVFLGVRPSGPTPMFHMNGRETFIAGIDWVDDWPVVDEERFTIPAPTSEYAVDFTTGAPLDGCWVSPGRLPADVCASTPEGLCITATGADGYRDLLAVRCEHPSWQASVDGDDLRLVVRMDDAHWIGIEQAHERLVVRGVVGPFDTNLAEATVPEGDWHLAVRTTLPAGPWPDRPDSIELGWIAADGAFTVVAGMDGRYLSTEVAGGFTGRVVGVEPSGPAPALVRGFGYRSL